MSPSHDAVPDLTQYATHALIAGDRSAGARGTFAVEDPADCSLVAAVADVDQEQARTAVAAAATGQAAWAQTPPRHRADVLATAAAALRRNVDHFARLITLEAGKPLAESVAEVRYAAGYLREYAERAPRIRGSESRREDGSGSFTTRLEPIGVAVAVTPWNFPLAMVARKAAPALAAGCGIVVKPAEETPLSAIALADLLIESGLRPDAVSVLPTSDSVGVVAALLDHPATAKISFTGSTRVGRALAEHGGRQLLRMSMELGGNAPFVVCEDADVPAAVAGAMIAKFRNGGQACTAANRFIVHEAVLDEFVEAFQLGAAGLTLGHGLASETTLGPLITERAVRRITDLVAEAVAAGATRVLGEDPPRARGRFLPPTILVGAPQDTRITTEEIFGPVASITAFATDDEALALANATDNGLASYVYTRDERRLRRFCTQIRAGMVGANVGAISDPAAPFGGIGASGYGREGGAEGLEEYLQTRYISFDRAT